ncbi:IDEAL domain-containing protein [Bacillus songklensis]|uniref:IDEAL domain-containing protein n=1 Tax=Bacillus songklensis TaxID=1069116 RepID=A0ABV8B392_9BACI
MLTNGNYRLEVGDWVKGKSRDGELIHGYIETIDPLQETVTVKVVECDHEEMIGKTIGMLNKGVKKLPVSTASNDEQLSHLIDLALLTRDEEWFMSLSAKLNSLRNVSKVDTKKDPGYPISRNSVKNSDIRG